MKKLFKLLFISLVSINSYSFDTTSEISSLNKEFNQHKDYPIIIFDKEIIRERLTESKEKNIDIIKKYMNTSFNIDLSNFEADTVLDYHTILNNSASALPFIKKDSKDYKFCAVFPSGAQTDHKSEVKRVLGISEKINPYPKDTVEKVMNIITLKELRLISLYHELSHCLDKTYIPNQREVESHSIHMAESFAETLSMLMVTKRFNTNNLALRRSILRGLYTKYMGKYIIKNQNNYSMHPSAKDMGIIYYLSPTLLSINKTLSTYKFRTTEYTTEQLGEIALENTVNFSFDSRTFASLINYLKNGEELVLETYSNLAVSSPDLFYPTYLRLRRELLFINDIDFLMDAI